MNEEIAIRVEGLHKQYRLGAVGSETLKDDIKLGIAKLFGRKFSDFYKIDENDRMLGESKYVWALQNINFDVKKGEILGIIGKNGAGKSTLLKVLSKVTGPTKGNIKVNGRIASLLEVGTGFHPELTGKENIFLNGAILGMSKNEISSKLDEIIDFSGIGKYLDTPVKRYSSGMKVRLGFSVAAHLEPDILIVDEVLAVGDIEFQKKCIGKMNDVSKNKGRTVLFVSHNMASVLELCHRGLLMRNGQVEAVGSISNIITKYTNTFRNEIRTQDLTKVVTRLGNGDLRFTHYKMINCNGEEIKLAYSGQDITFVFNLSVNIPKESNRIHLSMQFVNESEVPLFHLSNSISNGHEFKLREYMDEITVECKIIKLPLLPGKYPFHLFCSDIKYTFDEINFAGELLVEGGNFYPSGKLPAHKFSSFLVDNEWEIKPKI